MLIAMAMLAAEGPALAHPAMRHIAERGISMNLPINAGVTCADGPGGHSIAILLNPVSDLVTHLVVREPGLLGVDRMVPVELIASSTAQQIDLRSTKAELAQLPPFVTTNYLTASPGLLPGYAGDVLLWPYVGMELDAGVDHENTPPDELAIHRGSHVNATDGHIGQVEEFVFNPANNGITHVVLREGHLWSRQDITIPVAQIDHIDDDTVYLKLSKNQIDALPALAVHRRSS
jgi:uncharacterized protein YrrD